MFPTLAPYISELGEQIVFLFIAWIVASKLIVASYSRMLQRKHVAPTEIRAWTEAGGWARKLMTWAIAMIGLLVTGPAAEEILFRALLIHAFDDLSGWAWPAIVLSSVLFGIMHSIDRTFAASWIEHTSIDERHTMAFRIFRGCATGLLGIGFGYAAISSQSLYTSFFVHATWNASVALGIFSLALVLSGAILYAATVPFRWFGTTMHSWWRDRRKLKRQLSWPTDHQAGREHRNFLHMSDHAELLLASADGDVSNPAFQEASRRVTAEFNRLNGVPSKDDEVSSV